MGSITRVVYWILSRLTWERVTSRTHQPPVNVYIRQGYKEIIHRFEEMKKCLTREHIWLSGALLTELLSNIDERGYQRVGWFLGGAGIHDPQSTYRLIWHRKSWEKVKQQRRGDELLMHSTDPVKVMVQSIHSLMTNYEYVYFATTWGNILLKAAVPML
jgi:hypothetical protein